MSIRNQYSNSDQNNAQKKTGRNTGLLALSPLVVFLSLYLVSSLVAGDFYKVPISVAFVVASAYAVLITRKMKLADRLDRFSAGAAHKNIMLMIWIFVLAGAFAASAKAMGAVDATVNLTLRILPDNLLLPGIFLAACFISLAIGTSVGTIVALVPVAAGIAEQTGLGVPLMTAVVVGGAFFGDNLSFISDTTIAATRTQECGMRDKFKVNSMIVVPAAVVVTLLYLYESWSLQIPPQSEPLEWVKVIPYLVVLGTALAGMNVMVVLVLGLLITGVIGLATGSFGPFDWLGSMGSGISDMGQLIIVTLLAGGMLELIRVGGGIDYVIDRLTRRVRNKRGAELSIAALVSVANCCTANNTIAIITVGPIAKRIADRFGVDPRKSASILDTFSCFVQGLIPYGAQLLMAAGLTALSPLEIMRYLYYPMLMGGFALLSILFRFPCRYS